MTEEEKRIELTRYRLKQAEESLKEAQILFSSEMSLRSVINRAYYAMFYSVLALLIFEPFSSSKHSGIISYFNKRFIKSEIFPVDFGVALRDAFELRQSGDYRELYEPVREKVEPLLEKSKIFVDRMITYLKETKGL